MTANRNPSRRTTWTLVALAATSALLLQAPAGASAPAQQGRLARPGAMVTEAVPAVDGRPSKPGRIPEGTSQEAADLWDQLVRSLAPATERTPGPRSFELEFSGRIKTQDGSNDYVARFGYLDEGPGLVRAKMLNKRGEVKSIQMRGLGPGDAKEYWFRKLMGEAATDWIRLNRRDHRENLTELDTWASISYDIARLIEPSSFRIVELKRRRRREDSNRLKDGILDLEGDPGIRLPDTDLTGVVGGREKTLSQLAESLVWLELATPDFKDIAERKRRPRDEADQGPSTKRLVFGLDPKTHRPQLVIVAPHRSDMPLQVPGSLLVQCTDWIQSGDEGATSWIPGRFLSFEVERSEEGADGPRYRFRNATSADLYMHETSKMSANLRREDFLPPKD